MTEIPEFQIARLQLRDGDILVARTSWALDADTHRAVGRHIRASVGEGVRVLVLDRTFEISLLSFAGPAEPVEADEWRQAMEGLPAEPWVASDQVGGPGHGFMAHVFAGPNGKAAACMEMTVDPDQASRLAAWFALCRPSKIAALLDRLEAAEAKLAELAAVTTERDEARASWKEAADGLTLTGDALAAAQVILTRLQPAVRMALEHIEHMAAWITRQDQGYSFEGLGEDMPEIKAAFEAADGIFPVLQSIRAVDAELLQQLEAQHGRWRIWDGEHFIFTSLPERAAAALRRALRYAPQPMPTGFVVVDRVLSEAERERMAASLRAGHRS